MAGPVTLVSWPAFLGPGPMARPRTCSGRLFTSLPVSAPPVVDGRARPGYDAMGTTRAAPYCDSVYAGCTRCWHLPQQKPAPVAAKHAPAASEAPPQRKQHMPHMGRLRPRPPTARAAPAADSGRIRRRRRILIQFRRGAGDAVNAAQPAAEVNLLATRRAERPAGLRRGTSADWARGGLLRFRFLGHVPSPAATSGAAGMDRTATSPHARSAGPGPATPPGRSATLRPRPDAPVSPACAADRVPGDPAHLPR
jgi:hypothetical protein